MAIWLGHGGGLRLKRVSAGPIYLHIDPGDVDPSANRMSAERVTGALVTGDHVAIFYVNEQADLLTAPLPFMDAAAWGDNTKYPDGQWFVNVDAIGGVRFYSSWSDSIEGSSSNALPLLSPSSRIRIKLQLVDSDDHCLAQTKSWELNTNREVADITPLGEGFRKNMSTMVSGSGQLDCLFTAGSEPCVDDATHEKSIYLHRLVLRQEIGAAFTGVFLLKRNDALAAGLDPLLLRSELFYLCDCIITGVASQVDMESVIYSRVDFVTTGVIQLIFGYPKDYLAQEGTPIPGKVMQESSFGILLDTPT